MRTSGRLPIAAIVLIAALSAASPALANAPSGGAGLAPTGAHAPRIAPPPARHARGVWLHSVTVTEYWPAPEAWFVGRAVLAPGLAGRHRIDWLYSATGISMQGQGIGLDGRLYHLLAAGSGGWVTATGHITTPSDGWAAGPPFWRAGGYWLNAQQAPTFPLAAGGWAAGRGHRYVPLAGVRFAAGPSPAPRLPDGRALPLRYYGSIAVDPSVIPLGSRVYIPAYRHDGHGGWFIAQDTGGGILGRHIDVYRPPPAAPSDGGRYATGQRVFVIAPASGRA